MTPLGSNLKEGSSPGSHHLELLSEEKFRSRVEIENSLRFGKLASFTWHRNRSKGLLEGVVLGVEEFGIPPVPTGRASQGGARAGERGGTRGDTHEPVNERNRDVTTAKRSGPPSA